MPIGSLVFRSSYGNIAPEVTSAGVVLRGEVEWIVTGEPSDIAALLASVGPLGRAIQSQSAILKFGNVVGTFDLGTLGQLRVRCGKWGDDEFDSMLADLTQQLRALPFSAAQGAGIPHDRSLADHDEVLLHAFVYARHVLLAAKGQQSLVRALQAVVRDPHRRFSANRATVSLPLAQRIDARTLSRIAVGKERLVRAPSHLAHGGLANALGGRIPESVDVQHITHTHDTAENRFVLEFLRQVRAIIQRVEQLATWKTKPFGFWANIVADCAAMRRVIAPFERHDVWIGVRGMDHVPIGSTVLQRRRGYKEVLRHYLTMRAAVHIPLDVETIEKHLLGVKDVATLYELWCYFAVVGAVGRVLRRAPDFVEEYEVTIDKVAPGRGFCVTWTDGPTVHYNPTFTLTAKPPWRSASLTLRPDIVIEIERAGQVELHVFDAKLKVDGVVSLDTDTDTADIDVDETDPLKFKKEDVAKMHAYRDALPYVRSARVLYPGNVTREFPAIEVGARDTDVVGAVPLIPGQDPNELIRVLERMLGEGVTATSRATDNERQAPTIADLAAVAGMLDELQAIQTRPAEWSGGERDADGVTQMPYVTYAPAAKRLMRALYEHRLIVNFDWPSWQVEAQRFLDPEIAKTASVEVIRRLLTLHVRQERFVEGHFAEMISNGHITLLLERLGVLLSSGKG